MDFCSAVSLLWNYSRDSGLVCTVGLQAHLLKYYKTIEVLEQVEKHKCTVLNGVPTMFLALLHNQCRSQYDISQSEEWNYCRVTDSAC